MKKKRYLPFGYRMEPGQVLPVPEESDLLRHLFFSLSRRSPTCCDISFPHIWREPRFARLRSWPCAPGFPIMKTETAGANVPFPEFLRMSGIGIANSSLPSSARRWEGPFCSAGRTRPPLPVPSPFFGKRFCAENAAAFCAGTAGALRILYGNANPVANDLGHRRIRSFCGKSKRSCTSSAGRRSAPFRQRRIRNRSPCTSSA